MSLESFSKGQLKGNNMDRESHPNWPSVQDKNLGMQLHILDVCCAVKLGVRGPRPLVKGAENICVLA